MAKRSLTPLPVVVVLLTTLGVLVACNCIAPREETLGGPVAIYADGDSKTTDSAADPPERMEPSGEPPRPFGACEGDGDCRDGHHCLTDARGFPDGLCTLECSPRTPCDQGGCVSGECLPSCGEERTCDRPGYSCQVVSREYPALDVTVCAPLVSGNEAPSRCFDELGDAPIVASPWRLTPKSPTGTDEVCSIAEPVLIGPEIGGVTFVSPDGPTVMPADCRFATALVRFATVLRRHDIVRVHHVGTYNCRTIRDKPVLSMHARGLAIDVGAFETKSGQRWSVRRDWNTPGVGDKLKALTRDLHDEYVFNVILTPDYNDAHRDHLHLDLSEERHFLELDRETFLRGED